MTHPVPDAVEASALRSSRGRRLLPVLGLQVPATVLVATTSVASALRCPQGIVSVLAAATLLLMIGATGRARYEARARRAITEHDDVALAIGRLGSELLPNAVERLQRGEPVDEVLADLAPPAECASLTAAAHILVATALRQCADLGQGQLESAKRGFVALAQRVQGQLNRQLGRLSDMERRYSEQPEILAELFTLDHSTAQSVRLVDSIVILGGARPAKKWLQPVPMLSVLRGAASRIEEYRRIALQSVAKVDIDGPAVEALIHALAELLDNATRFSPPQTSVYVSATEYSRGVVIEIQDGGVGLPEEEARRATHLLSGQDLDLEDLGEAPRLGLAVAGRLCALSGASVELQTSIYGGVRAVMFISKDKTRTAAEPGEAPLVVPARAVARAAQGPDVALIDGQTSSGLPIRRCRDRQLHTPRPAPAPTTVNGTEPVDPRTRHAFLGAMQQASRRTDPAPDLAYPPTDEQGHDG